MSHRVGAALVVGLSFALYTWTTCPTVYVGDAGELIASAYSIGVPHPPGYPLFTVIGKILSVVCPVGSIAFRVNLSTALCAALAVGLVGWFLKRLWVGTSWWPWVLALGFGVSRTFWSQATQAEVYALHLLVVLTLLGSAWGAKKEEIVKTACWVSLVWGVGLAHHHTVLLLGVVWLGCVVAALRAVEGRSRWSWAVMMGGLVSVGLSAYVILQIRALADPSMNWGDPETFGGLNLHMLRKQYGSLNKQPRSWPLMGEQWSLYVKSLSGQWGWWALVPALWGWIRLVKIRQALAWRSLYLWGLYSLGLVVLLNYKVTPQYEDIMKVFFMPSYLALLVGWGAWCEGWGTRWRPVALGAAAVVLVGSPLIMHARENNLGRHLTGYFYGRNILMVPEVPSYLFLAQDNEVFTAAYLKKVERWREPNLVVYDELGCVFDNIYGAYFLTIGKSAHQQRLKTIQRDLLGSTDRPIYYVLASAYRKFEDLKDAQQGIVFTAHPGRHVNGEVGPWRRMETSALWQSPDDQEYLVRDILAQYHLLLGDWHRHRGERDLSVREFQRAGIVGQTVDWVQSNVGSALMREGRLSEAIAEYERSIQLNPRKATAFYDLAIAYNKAGRIDDAIVMYRKALDIDPRYASARNNLGNIFLRQGKIDEAIREYQVGIEADPENLQALFNLGGALEELKKYDQAKQVYEQVLVRNPRYVEAMNNLAGLHLTRGEVGKAVEWYQKAIAENPQYVDARYNLGFAYFLAAQQLVKQGQTAEARSWVEQATAQWHQVLQIQPDHALSKDRLRDAQRILSNLR